MEKNIPEQELVSIIRKLLKLVFFLLTIIVFLVADNIFNFSTFFVKRIKTKNIKKEIATKKEDLWEPSDESLLNSNSQKELILFGKDLIANTSTYFGPKGKIFSSSNGMNCQNCHLHAGTKPFGNNFGSVASIYPKFRERSGSVENIYKRINDCFERSLNGSPLDTNSREMHAMASYIQWLGEGVPKGEKAKGSGLKDIPYIDRAADEAKGELVYLNKCQSCHLDNGQGQLNKEGTAYQYPPLWGINSYNDAAGLFRISSFAKFVKYNMPLGVNHNNPQLTDEEAWDVAAFVNSQPRPHKNVPYDWPKKEKKPIDMPFGPYADLFTESQHKYGPFKPIVAYYEKMAKK